MRSTTCLSIAILLLSTFGVLAGDADQSTTAPSTPPAVEAPASAEMNLRRALAGRAATVAGMGGFVLKVDPMSITIRGQPPATRAAPAVSSSERTFTIDENTRVMTGQTMSERTTDTGQVVRSVRMVSGTVGDIQPGQRVSIRSDGDIATMISITPAVLLTRGGEAVTFGDPNSTFRLSSSQPTTNAMRVRSISGRITKLEPTAITVTTRNTAAILRGRVDPTAPPSTAPVERTFRIDASTRLSQGAASERTTPDGQTVMAVVTKPASFADLKVGQTVSIRDGQSELATSITIMPNPITRRIPPTTAP